ncbi:imidazolonepropionase [Oceanicaulis sp. MMSF_3324]|uniref:imidazolonepropionase n=1 Tax=Oceanicaulis sp. MMSF_3324 TaxID=3046702 RepID=UPI00273EA438|nr:imidazolonepropionase [Oceanicaulis sp. MMSF_3324]
MKLLTDLVLAGFDAPAPYGRIARGALVLEGDQILYAGPQSDLPARHQALEPTSLGGRLVTPGLIDCHTHLVYGGSRAREFEMRQSGASYAEISKAGGGIVSTVAATREASEATLIEQALVRLDRLIADGVTTVEIKSGYGLDRDTELKQLRVSRRLGELRPVRIVTSFLGAHAIPKGMDADAYIDTVCIPTLKEAASEGLVDMVDGFCESIAFTPAQIERVFGAATELGLPVKLHAEQLSDQGGAALAARYGAKSVEHLEYISDDDIAALAKAGSVAVMLPGAFYFLKETRKPPIEGFRCAGVPMAVSTDSNPGSSPMTSLLLAMNMSATFFGLTPEEALKGVTVNAAKALARDDLGRLAPGCLADLAIWDVTDPAELTYRMGDAPLHARYLGGEAC